MSDPELDRPRLLSRRSSTAGRHLSRLPPNPDPPQMMHQDHPRTGIIPLHPSSDPMCTPQTGTYQIARQFEHPWAL